MDARTDQPRLPVALVLDAPDVDALPQEPLGDLPGVARSVLWRAGGAESGVLHIEPGSRLGEHVHRENQHHLWVLRGHAVIAGVRVGPGGYAHVPQGVEHDIDATATEGCTVAYLYAR